MHGQRTTAVAIAAALALSGCATMRENPTACHVASALVGGALGATGGGVGVDQIEKGPDNGERAAGAAAGLVAGSLVGLGVSYLICPEEEPPPPPRVAPAPPPPPPPGTKMAELRAAHFDFNKAVLKPEGERKVDEAISAMQQNPGLRVSVEGHTDSVGSDSYNMRLGERRANAVRNYMVSKGVAANRIDVRSYGESRPVASNKTPEGRAQNRRVEIIAE